MAAVGQRFDLCSVIGSCMLLFPVGIHAYWGNMSVYTASYFARESAVAATFELPWIISFALLARDGLLLAIECITKFVKAELVLVCGIVCFNLGVFISYYSMDVSRTMLNVTMGALSGFGAGLLNAIIIKKVLQSSRSDLGLVTSIIQSSYSAGAIVITQGMSLYINPNNASPDREVHEIFFFSQNSVLDNVRSTFVVLGLMSFTIQTVGFMLLMKVPFRCRETCFKKEKISDRQPNCRCDVTSRALNSSNGSTSNEDNMRDNQGRFDILKQLLRSRTFYLLCCIGLLKQYIYLHMANYYKSYGQTWIKNDHFLSTLGTAKSLFTALARPLNGFILDKFGVKNNLVGTSLIMTFTTSFFYTSLMINRWFYCVVVCTFFAVNSAQTSSFTVAPVKYFGNGHVGLKVGLVHLPGLIMQLMAPPFMALTLTHYGWFALTCEAAGVMATIPIIATLFLPCTHQ